MFVELHVFSSSGDVAAFLAFSSFFAKDSTFLAADGERGAGKPGVNRQPSFLRSQRRGNVATPRLACHTRAMAAEATVRFTVFSDFL
jgi:hypothetical protein